MYGKFLRFKYTLNTLIFKLYIKWRHPSIQLGINLQIRGKLIFSAEKNSKISLGDNIIINSNTRFNLAGINKPMSIEVRNNAVLEIGNNSGFSGTSIYASQKIVIGSHCHFGVNTFIWDTDFHPLEYLSRRAHDISKIATAPIFIGDDVFIGANSIVLKGVTIGDRSIIAAGSIVSRTVPSDEIWGGNPASFIKKCT